MTIMYHHSCICVCSYYMVLIILGLENIDGPKALSIVDGCDVNSSKKQLFFLCNDTSNSLGASYGEYPVGAIKRG